MMSEETLMNNENEQVQELASEIQAVAETQEQVIAATAESAAESVVEVPALETDAQPEAVDAPALEEAATTSAEDVAALAETRQEAAETAEALDREHAEAQAEAALVADEPLAVEDHAAEDALRAEANAIVLDATGFDETALMALVEAAIADEAQIDGLIAGATPDHLILLIEALTNKEEIRPYIRKMGVVKRAFDILKDRLSLEKPRIVRFSTALGAFNRKRAEYLKQAEEEKKHNAVRKRALLMVLKGLVDSENPMNIDAIRAVQEEWKAVGHVPKEDMDLMYNEYRFSLDQFFKQREDHFKMLDYDRDRNLKAKEAIIAEIETLVTDGEEVTADVWRSRTAQVEELQERWKKIGYVPKDDVERINVAYRATLDKFFDARRALSEQITAELQENTTRKQGLIERLKEFEAYTADKPKDWNDTTVVLQAIQEEWKTIGRALNEVNNDLWMQYRAICNGFFERKNEFFKELDSVRMVNMQAKESLIERAEALKSSGDWAKTARELKKIQDEWKETGPVPEKFSNKLWNRFRKACDDFFEARRNFYQGLHADEQNNLTLKENLIEEVKKIATNIEISADEAIEVVKDIQSQWKEIGKVPFKQKDAIWDKFRKEIDSFFEALSGKRRTERPAGGGGGYGGGKPRQEKEDFNAISDPDERSRSIKERIMRVTKRMDAIKLKLEQYNNNIQYISKGKSGDVLRTQIQKEIDSETRLLNNLRDEVKQLREMLKAPSETPVEAIPETPIAESEREDAEDAVSEEAASEEAAAESSETEA